MTRRRYVSPPVEPAEGDEWLRARTNLGTDDEGRSSEPPPAESPEPSRPPAGVRTEPPIALTPEQQLRAHLDEAGHGGWSPLV